MGTGRLGIWDFFRRTDRAASADLETQSLYQPDGDHLPAMSGSHRKVERNALPRFRGLIGRPAAATGTRSAIERARTALRDVFTPAQPVTKPRLFAGRYQALKHLIEVIEHRMSHVVIFGERGMGKTSLLHILGELAGESHYIVLKGTCGARSDFDVMFRTMLTNVPLRFYAGVSPTSRRSEEGETLADLLPAERFDARELSELLGSITSTRVLIILDEYDRIESEVFRQSIAELIKNLSDVAARVQIIIAGVSSNLDELIGYIPSIRRNIIGLPLQRLTALEVSQILRIGEQETGVAFHKDTGALIAQLANGSPYLVRLMCFHSSLIALDKGRLSIEPGDVAAGLSLMVEEAEARLPVGIAQCARRMLKDDDTGMLALVAGAASTADGWFTATDVIERTDADVSEPDVTAYLSRFEQHHLLERRPGLTETCFRFVDEGLANFFWIEASRDLVQGRPNAR